MAYKDILVHIDSPASQGRYAIAAELAARGEGVLTGLYLRTTLINQYVNIGSIGYLPPEDLDQLIREHNRGQDEAAQAAAAALQAAATAAGVGCEWRAINGDTAEALVAESRRADITVTGAPAPNPAYNAHGTAVDVALGGPGPVLVAPQDAAQTRVGGRVLVAWNGSREAARALREALPLLDPQSAVSVLSIRPKGADLAPDDALRRHLERLGFKPKLTVVADNAEAHGLINQHARAIDADLIVMGLYGHSRMQEFVLGGASRAMLHDTIAPLLIAH